jgi:cytochrome c oxidase subunit II
VSAGSGRPRRRKAAEGTDETRSQVRSESGGPRRPWRRCIQFLLWAAASAGLSACTLQPASDRAKSIQLSYQITFVVAAVIFVVVGSLIVFSTLAFRRKRGDEAMPTQVHGSTKLEMVWIAVPSLIVVVLFIVSATTLGKVDWAAAGPMRINVEGFQWQWRFTYPEFKTRSGAPLAITGQSGHPGDGTYGKPTLGLEVNKAVHFNLVSDDVIHSFFIPVFLFKRDVIPGHPNEFDLTPDRIGTFAGKCAELCGLEHSTMLFVVKIMPHDQFQQWVANAIKVQQHQEWVAANSCKTPTAGKITVVAKSIRFDTSCIEVPAGGTTQLVFDNKDTAGTPHNIEIFTDRSAISRLAGATSPSDCITAPGTATYQISGLQPGTYFFRCDIHPTQM